MFGVWINGVNYALVPGMLVPTPISVSTINCGGPTSGPAPNVGGQNCSMYRDNPPFFDTIDSEIDGFTIPISLSMPVRSGVVNTIQIGIADNLDSFGDSALLLASGSIAAIPEPSTIALMLAGIFGIAGISRRRRRPGARRRERVGLNPVAAGCEQRFG